MEKCNIIGYHTLKIALVMKTTSEREACPSPYFPQQPSIKMLPLMCYEQ
jgi:hypothetical protein